MYANGEWVRIYHTIFSSSSFRRCIHIVCAVCDVCATLFKRDCHISSLRWTCIVMELMRRNKWNACHNWMIQLRSLFIAISTITTVTAINAHRIPNMNIQNIKYLKNAISPHKGWFQIEDFQDFQDNNVTLILLS